ncbi:ClpP/crotonase-like domain-containing protein [Trichophaea hybrida]|nr:ClpP/crotonase-like domain-containing protein [Trichophaea hybrida]
MSRPFFCCARGSASSPLALLRTTTRLRLPMPLRAKVTNPAFSRPYSSEMDTPAADDVLFNSIYGVRTIELNRAAKLNALNGSMISKIRPRLQEWEKSQLANIIIIKGAGEKSFCAGGDVATLALLNKAGKPEKSVEFFKWEYQLDHLIATYSKPYVAFMDGITMGGGVGLSVHAPFRVATERTMFAMPETTIGFFPDVGGSFFLPRLDGEIGTYLALTSERLVGADTLYAGIATHYIHSSSLPDVESRLAELVFEDTLSLPERWSIINDTLEEFSTGLPSTAPAVLTGSLRECIDRCFAHDTIEEIISSLPSETQHQEWATKTIATLQSRSPTSLRVALKQLRLGRDWTIGETFQREHYIATKFMSHPDFISGVSSRLIERPPTTPTWNPPTLEECPESSTDDFFTIPEASQRLNLLKPGAPEYSTYPHEVFGLPSEAQIKDVIKRARMPAKELVEWYVREYKGKEGVREKVREVLVRKAESDEMGFVVWKGILGL